MHSVYTCTFVLYDGWIDVDVCVSRMDVDAPTIRHIVFSCVCVSIHMYFTVHCKENSNISHAKKTASWLLAYYMTHCKFSIPQSLLAWIGCGERHTRRRQRFSLRMFSIFLCCFLCLSLCVRDVDCVIMLTVRFAFTSYENFHNKSEQSKSDNSYGACSASKKGLCCVCIVLHNVFSICIRDENIRFCIFQVRFDVCLNVCDAMRYFLWFCAVAKPMTWPTVNSHAHAHTFPIQMINMLSIFDLNKMRRNQCELYTHYTYSRHPNCTCKFVVCTQKKCVSMCICFSLCALFV